MATNSIEDATIEELREALEQKAKHAAEALTMNWTFDEYEIRCEGSTRRTKSLTHALWLARPGGWRGEAGEIFRISKAVR